MNHKLRQKSLPQIIWPWTFAIVCGGWLVSTLLFACALSSNGKWSQSLVPRGVALSVTLLKVLTEGFAIILTALLSSVLDIISWTAVRQKRGLSFPTFLALSGTTGIGGLLTLLKWRGVYGSSVFPSWHAMWVILRFIFPMMKFDFRLSILCSMTAIGVVILSNNFPEASLIPRYCFSRDDIFSGGRIFGRCCRNRRI